MKYNIALNAFQIELEKQLGISVSITGVAEREGAISFYVVADAFAKMSFRNKINAIKMAKKSAANHCDKIFWPNCITTAEFAKSEVIENAIRSFQSLSDRATA